MSRAPVNNPNQLNAIFHRTIENQVTANGKRTQVWSQILDAAPDLWRGSDNIKRRIKLVDEAISSNDVPERDIMPYLVVIEPGLPRSKDVWHSCLRRTLLLCQAFAALCLYIFSTEFIKLAPIGLLDAN